MHKQHLQKAILVSLLISLLFFGASFYVPLESLLSFPFAQIAAGLRILSFSGTAGNILSLFLYLALSFSPAVLYFFINRKRKVESEDHLLLLLSVFLLVIFYLMINPSYLGMHFGGIGYYSGSLAICGILLYSLMATYLGLRLLRTFSQAEEKSLLTSLKLFLLILSMATVFAVLGLGLVQLKGAFINFQQGNTETVFFDATRETGQHIQGLGFSYFFLLLQYASGALPLVLSLFVIHKTYALILEVEKSPFSEEVGSCAKRLADFAKKSVKIILLVQFGVNFFQFLLGSAIKASHYNLSFPFAALMMVILALIFAKYFEKMKVLKEDVDSFI